MNSRKIFFALSIFGLIGFNIAAMEPEAEDAAAGHVAAPAQELVVPEVVAPAAQIEPFQALRTLREELTVAQACVNRLIICVNPKTRIESPIQIIHGTLTSSQRLVQGVIEHNQDMNAQAIVQRLNHIIDQLRILTTPNSQYADGVTPVDRLFDQMREIGNEHLVHIRACNQTIDTLRARLRNYILQGIEDDTQAPLENADRNLVREINAFFLFTQRRLIEAHQSIDVTIREVVKLYGEIVAAQQILEIADRSEEMIAQALPADGPAPDDAPAEAAAAQAQPSFFSGLLSGTKRFVTGPLVRSTRLFVESALPNRLAPADIGQELARAQESIGSAIARLDETLQRFRVSAALEDMAIRNLKTLCTILDCRILDNPEEHNPHYNPHFHLHDQDEVERSLATAILASNLRTPLIRACLGTFGQRQGAMPRVVEFFLTRMYPEAFPATDQRQEHAHQGDELQPINPRQPRYPIAGRILYGAKDFLYPQGNRQPQDPSLPGLRNMLGQVAPELPGILADDDRLEYDIQLNGQQTFDDRYTSFLINTQNPQYVLYDIAARTRFNTGRFSYLIRPFVHKAEETFGGPLKETEQPGDRYSQLMNALADESTPLEHPWLLFSMPPRLVSTVENIFRIAHTDNDPLPPANIAQAAADQDTEAPFTSTSLQSFLWNGLKKVSRWPVRQITPILTSTLRSCGNYIQRGADIITGPFIDRRPIMAVRSSIIAAKDFIEQKIKTMTVSCARTARWLLLKINDGQTVRNLERNMREGHPASESLAQIQEFVANHELEGMTRPIQAAIAHNHKWIRAFAQKYENIQRIDPLIHINPITREPNVQEAIIRNAWLRNDLASFTHYWARQENLH